MTRNTVDLSHIVHLAGHIGRLQTVSVIPVLPGESLKINMSGIIRMAPTRKEIVSEAQVDVFAFYVKHRHVYGQEWMEFVRLGPQAENNFTGIPVAADYRDCFYLGIKECGAEVNRALVYGYNYILARNFQVPNTNGNGEYENYMGALDFYPTNQSFAKNMRRFGATIARPPHILNAFTMQNWEGIMGWENDLTQEDYGVLISDATPDVGILDVRELDKIKARFSSVQEANWFSATYDDILQTRYGSKGVNTDADPRPDYLGRATFMMSGQDINGADDATLGSYVGKALDSINFQMRRRVFPEHGNVWIMMAVRYPLIHTNEQHPLLVNPTPDAQLLLGDPKLYANEPPVQFDPAKWLAGGSFYTPNEINVEPYGNEYRFQPNRVHPNFAEIPGYPFIAWDTTIEQDWYYYKNDEYKNTFQTTQVGQWQVHAEMEVLKYTNIPVGTASIFTGA